jgi:hypothetical protein
VRDSPLNDQPYREKTAELLRLLDADHVPPRIKSAVPCLSQCHSKLFVMVCEPSPAIGTPHLSPGIYPYNLLCELVEAIRALEWPKVLVLVHRALSDKGSANSSAETTSCAETSPAQKLAIK